MANGQQSRARYSPTISPQAGQGEKMKLPGNRLRLSSGKLIKFKSAQARANWEKVAQAFKHGWRPKLKK